MISLSNQEKLNIISNLGTLLTGGIPVLEAVESLLKDAKGSSKKILLQLKDDIGQGRTIAVSFAKFPDAFDPITVNLIKAAEQSGNLDTVLKDLALSIKQDIEFSDKVKTALTYPGLVFVVFAGVLLLILGFVVPRIASTFAKLKVTLPLPTKIMIGASNLLLDYTPFVVGLTVLVIIGLIFTYRTKKKELLNFLYSLPFLSNLAREIDFARFTHSLSLLLSSGIPITEALDLTRNIVYKKEIERMILHTQETVSAGKKISEGLRSSKVQIPDTMIRIIEAGEKSGKLEESMQELSEYFEGRVNNSLKTLITMLEPALLVVIGVLVGGLMLSIIAPIYQLIGQIKGR